MDLASLKSKEKSSIIIHQSSAWPLQNFNPGNHDNPINPGSDNPVNPAYPVNPGSDYTLIALKL